MRVPKEMFGQETYRKGFSASAHNLSKGLKAKIVDIIFKGKNFDTHGVLISNIRHIKALRRGSK